MKKLLILMMTIITAVAMLAAGCGGGEKKAAAEKKLAEKKMRKEAVDEAVANAFRLARAYIRDYGSYDYEGETDRDCIWPSKIWHYFG